MKIKVYAVGKSGIKTGFSPDIWLNYGQGITSASFAKGNEYEIVKDQSGLIVGATLVSTAAPTPAKTAAPAANTFKRTFTPRKGKADEDRMSKEEWAAKDLRISRQGVIQAAVQALAPAYPNPEKLMPLAEVLADKMLAYVNKA